MQQRLLAPVCTPLLSEHGNPPLVRWPSLNRWHPISPASPLPPTPSITRRQPAPDFKAPSRLSGEATPIKPRLINGWLGFQIHQGNVHLGSKGLTQAGVRGGLPCCAATPYLLPATPATPATNCMRQTCGLNDYTSLAGLGRGDRLAGRLAASVGYCAGRAFVKSTCIFAWVAATGDRCTPGCRQLLPVWMKRLKLLIRFHRPLS